LTYTTLFAIAPLLVITFLVLSNLPFDPTPDQNLETFVADTFPWVPTEEVAPQLDRLSQRAKKLSYAGVIILLATIILLLRSIELSFNEIYCVRSTRSRLRRFLTYMAITLVSAILLALSIAFHSFLFSFDTVAELASLTGIEPKYLSVMPLVVSAMSYSAIYLIVPNTRVPVVFALMGGTAVTLAFELARRGFDMFFATFARHDLVYGAFAFVPAFLMWINLSWIIILTGLLLVKLAHDAWGG